jgi:hypothetical protein
MKFSCDPYQTGQCHLKLHPSVLGGPEDAGGYHEVFGVLQEVNWAGQIVGGFECAILSLSALVCLVYLTLWVLVVLKRRGKLQRATWVTDDLLLHRFWPVCLVMTCAPAPLSSSPTHTPFLPDTSPMEAHMLCEGRYRMASFES